MVASRIVAAGLLCVAATLAAQAPARDGKAIVKAAVDTELASNRTDHTAFLYRDRDITPDGDVTWFTIETPEGSYKRKLEDHGKPLDASAKAAEAARVQAAVKDAAAVKKQHDNSAHDDDQAEQMLKLLPAAYLWTVAGEQGTLVTLNFKPDPAFSPGNMEARVLSAMAGTVVVDRAQNRIRSIKGTLVDDVKFGFGIFGRLHKGGSFQVERREVAPHHWQMTENHTHIDGKALFFKSIGSIEDETRSDFKVSPAQTVAEAYQYDQKH